MKRHVGVGLFGLLVGGILLPWAPAIQSQVAVGRNLKMDCSYCHNVHGTGQLVVSGEAAIEALCQTCHATGWTDPNDATKEAAIVKAHELLSGKANYGTYKISCIGCHNPHRYLANADTSQPTGEWGNLSLIGNLVKDADTTRDAIPQDGIARLARPFINDGGTPADFDDDTMEGYYCGVNTVSGNPNPCSETDPPASSDSVRKVVHWKKAVDPAQVEIDPWENQWSQGEFDGQKYIHVPAPTLAGQRWYNGACNVCHTRTGHHRRDNSGGDRDHNLEKIAGCPECHDHNANKGGWIK